MLVITVCALFLALSNSVYAYLTADITVVDEFGPYDVLGCADIKPDSSNISVIYPFHETIALYDLENGTYQGEITLDVENTDPWGCAYNSATSDYIAVNDLTDDVIYWYGSGSWHTFSNPAGNNGRGMDIDGNNTIWEAQHYDYNNAYIWSFGLYGSNPDSFLVDQQTGNISGLTVFFFDGSSHIMYITDFGNRFYFYSTDGTFQGSAEVPNTVDNEVGKGLSYCENRDTFYFVCQIENYPPLHGIYELDFDFYYTAIQSTSLGSIKALFE